MLLALTLEELWVVQERVRQDKEYGAPWDREEMGLVHQAILSLEADGGETYDLRCSTGFLRAIEGQVPQGLIVGTMPIGRSILRKVFRALHSYGDDDVPKSFTTAFGNGDPSTDETNHNADTEAGPLGNLP